MEQHQTPSAQTNIVVVGKSKSVGVAFILAFFFGPLGLLYASVLGGIVMFFAGILLFLVLPVVGAVIAWIGCLIWAVVAANAENEKLRKTAVTRN